MFSRKAMEMSMSMIVVIVIGLVVIIIAIYMIAGKSKALQSVSSCSDSDCVLPGKTCTSGSPGLTVCTKEVTEGGKTVKKTGRCCVPDES